MTAIAWIGGLSIAALIGYLCRHPIDAWLDRQIAFKDDLDEEDRW